MDSPITQSERGTFDEQKIFASFTHTSNRKQEGLPKIPNNLGLKYDYK
jgi:hypothetical protein